MQTGARGCFLPLIWAVQIAPDDLFTVDGPAGTALVFESQLWYTTGGSWYQSKLLSREFSNNIVAL